MDLLSPFNSIIDLLGLAVLVFEVFAFVDASLRQPQAYIAADKQQKAFWLIILGLAVVWTMFMGFLGIIGIIGVIAAIVYVVDARPALRAVGRGGGQSTGPYGPW